MRTCFGFQQGSPSKLPDAEGRSLFHNLSRGECNNFVDLVQNCSGECNRYGEGKIERACTEEQ